MENFLKPIRTSVDTLTKLTTELGEHASWSPMGKGRTALDQIAECALITSFAAGIIRSKSVPPVDWAAFGAAKAELSVNTETALAALAANTETLAGVLETLTEEDAATTVTLPWGEVVSLIGVAGMVYWNNTYHEGQINLIQQMTEWGLPA